MTDEKAKTGKKVEKKTEKKAVVPKKSGHHDEHDVVRDTLRVPGTPGSPTGQGSPGMPGEEPIPGTR
jgi:hypothetical protein